MHETIVARRLIEEAKKHGKVRSITVEVGELAHLPLEDLKPTLNEMVDWQVNYKLKKAKVKCDCGYVGPPNILLRTHEHTYYECPRCGKVPRVLEGQYIKLVKVEVE